METPRNDSPPVLVPARRVKSAEELEDFREEMRMDAMLDRDPPED
jgi:hypothetical protein